MKQLYLGSSVTVISPIDVLTDNTNRLYNNGGTLFFNGTAVGAGAADNNVWVNANDHSTYTTLSGLIDTVQDNVSAGVDAAANDYNTYTTVVSLVDTVQDNVTALPDSAANDHSTYTTLSGLIDTVQSNVTALPDSAANDHSTYTTLSGLIDTVQSNVTALPDSAANDHSTYTTLSGLIDTVSANTEFTISVTVSGGVFVIDGTSQQTVTLTPSITYRFDQSDSTNTNHPLRLSTTDNGTHVGGVAFTIGVTEVGTPGSAGAYTEVTLEQDAPTSLYYYCGNHSGMGGEISIGGGGLWSEEGTDIYFATGHVTIGPGASYAAASNLYVNGNTYVTGNVEVGDTLIELSSQAIKTNIVPLTHQLSKIQLLNPVEYDKIHTNNHELGLIAEEVSSILPHVVTEGNTAISYTRIVPVLIQALKELKQEVDDLKRNLDGRT